MLQNDSSTKHHWMICRVNVSICYYCIFGPSSTWTIKTERLCGHKIETYTLNTREYTTNLLKQTLEKSHTLLQGVRSSWCIVIIHDVLVAMRLKYIKGEWFLLYCMYKAFIFWRTSRHRPRQTLFSIRQKRHSNSSQKQYPFSNAKLKGNPHAFSMHNFRTTQMESTGTRSMNAKRSLLYRPHIYQAVRNRKARLHWVICILSGTFWEVCVWK